jgi:hypothetical protein
MECAVQFSHVPIWQSPSIDKYAMRLETLMNQIRRRSCHGMCRVVFYIKNATRQVLQERTTNESN